MQRRMQLGLLLSALAIGMGIAWIDSRPTWDDTGITAGLVFLTTAAFGAAAPRYAWVWALGVGVWIPLVGLAASHSAGSLLALGIAFLGAYSGRFARHVVQPATDTNPH